MSGQLKKGHLKWRRRRKKQWERMVLLSILVVLVLAGILIAYQLGKEKKDPKYIPVDTQGIQTEEQAEEPESQKEEVWSFSARETEKTMGLPESVVSEYGILIDVNSGEILAQKGAHERISPAMHMTGLIRHP